MAALFNPVDSTYLGIPSKLAILVRSMTPSGCLHTQVGAFSILHFIGRAAVGHSLVYKQSSTARKRLLDMLERKEPSI